jgi:hypothetical protein
LQIELIAPLIVYLNMYANGFPLKYLPKTMLNPDLLQIRLVRAFSPLCRTTNNLSWFSSFSISNQGKNSATVLFRFLHSS